MGLGNLGSISFDWNWISALFSVIIINLVRSVDNAMVVAVALRSLPKRLRFRAIVFSACITIVLSVFLTYFASKLLAHSFVRLVGGAIVLYLAVTLLVLRTGATFVDETISRIGQAVKILVIANITMSLDNMLAVAGASQGNFFLLFIGLGVSIPVVFFASNLLCLIIERYPILNYVGCAVLAKVGADMILTDPFVVRVLAPTTAFNLSAQIASVVVVLACGHFWMKIAGSEQKE
ncbi:MAG: YjbE family putative metal transport protein [Syntrophobacteraceae bacterium]|jgi:YjbE family integral membrane protein